MIGNTPVTTVLGAFWAVQELLLGVATVAPAWLESSGLTPLQSGLPPVVDDLAGAAPPLNSLAGAVLYGGGSVAGIGGGKRLLSRLRARLSAGDESAATPAATSVSTVTSGGTPASIEHDEAAFTLPEAVPLSKGVRKVTHNEVHALELGVVVGFATVWLFSIGRQTVAGGITLAFVAGALGLKRYRTKALATVRMEPWYALMAFAVGAVAGWLFFIGPG